MCSTVRLQVLCFSTGDSNMKEKAHSRLPCTAVTTQNEVHLDQLICTNQLMMVTAGKNSSFLADKLLSNSAIVLIVPVAISMEKIGGNTFRVICVSMIMSHYAYAAYSKFKMKCISQ